MFIKYGWWALCGALLLCACNSDSDRPVTGDLSSASDGQGLNLHDGTIVPLLDAPREGGAVVDGAQSDGPHVDASLDGLPPAVDTQPPARDIERTLAFTSAGGTEWLHIFARAAGANSISARTAHLSAALVPPYDSVFTQTIPSGECKSASLSGTLLDGRTFLTTITYCFDNDQVQVSHVASVDGQPPGTGQNHGAASLDPNDAAQPYERSLLFVGVGGTEWLHVARRASGSTNVDIETFNYNEALDPATNHFTLTGVAPGACKSHVVNGTLVSSGLTFSTRVEHCRVGDQLTIAHETTSNGTTNPPNAHGSIPIE